jgi:glutathione gamma-glutamylcysteinyltransferase
VLDSEIWQERVIRVKVKQVLAGSFRIYHDCRVLPTGEALSTELTVSSTVVLPHSPRTHAKSKHERPVFEWPHPNDPRRPMGPRSAAAALRLRGPCLARCLVSHHPNAALFNNSSASRPVLAPRLRVFQSTAAAASASLRPFESHPDEHVEHADSSEQDCLWLSSRHCRTCACQDDSSSPPSSATHPLSSARSADTNAPLASTKNGLLPTLPSNPRPKVVADKQQQQEDTIRLRSQEPNDANNHNPLASRLMEMMSAPAASSSVLQPPIPAYSVRRRVLPKTLTSLNSPQGQDYLVHALVNKTAASYLPLTLHFANQSDPAFCGITTLLVVLNAMSIDPHTRWKGGWRYFGDEESLLGRCCLSVDHVQSLGITMDEFYRLASCQGLRVHMKRAISSNSNSINAATINGASDASPLPSSMGSLEEFRRDVISVLTDRSSTPGLTKKKVQAMMVVSFGRSGLQQTGDGHFSPVAAYHSETDQVLVLDVARFKYPPYWVSVKDLFEAMTLLDQATRLPRGWFVLQKPSTSTPRRRRSSTRLDKDEDEEHTRNDDDGGEDRRPAHLVPPQKEASWCPLHKVKLEYCKNVTNKGGSGGTRKSSSRTK